MVKEILKKIWANPENKFIILTVVFAAAYFLVLFPLLFSKFQSSNPFMQFLIFTVGVFFILFIFNKSYVLGMGITLKRTIHTLLLFLALDTFTPDFHVSATGELIKTSALAPSTVDYVFGTFYQSIGITGFFLFVLVFIITPGLLLYLAKKVNGNFVRSL